MSSTGAGAATASSTVAGTAGAAGAAGVGRAAVSDKLGGDVARGEVGGGVGGWRAGGGGRIGRGLEGLEQGAGAGEATSYLYQVDRVLRPPGGEKRRGRGRGGGHRLLFDARAVPRS